jgi:uncharacterized membrane protein YbaN (DUF454 family)
MGVKGTSEAIAARSELDSDEDVTGALYPEDIQLREVARFRRDEIDPFTGRKVALTIETETVVTSRRWFSLKPLIQLFFITAGWISLALGFIGIFLPLLPTTPFVLLAALCFSKGSPRLHRWLCSTRVAGQIIRDWEEHGMIRRRTKIVTTVLMLVLTSYPVFFMPMWPIYRVLMGLTTVAVLTFIWTRPSVPGQKRRRQRPGAGQ